MKSGQKILLVAGFFPPFAPSSATRAPALAHYLLESGYDVRVLAARNTRMQPTLTHRLPEDRVIYAPVVEAREFRPREIHPGDATSPLTQFAAALRAATTVPDMRTGWLPYAVKAGRALAETWKPDLIYASAPPHTSLLVAARLARRLGVPWIAEFRDLWTAHPYYDRRGLLKSFEQWLERRTLRKASGLVTVTQGWASLLSAEYHKPVLCVLNGYDAADFPATPAPRQRSDGPLTLVYGGGLYGGKRNPRPLFLAIRALGWGADDITIKFFVDDPGAIGKLAADYGIGECVTAQPTVTREEILKVQEDADILLLMRWDAPGEDHVLAGKLFEYIGCRRPILSIGRRVGEAADIIRNHRLGVVGEDAAHIAGQLKRWLKEKRAGGIAAPTPTPPEQFSRHYQFARLTAFFEEIIRRDCSDWQSSLTSKFAEAGE